MDSNKFDRNNLNTNNIMTLSEQIGTTLAEIYHLTPCEDEETISRFFSDKKIYDEMDVTYENLNYIWNGIIDCVHSFIKSLEKNNISKENLGEDVEFFNGLKAIDNMEKHIGTDCSVYDLWKPVIILSNVNGNTLCCVQKISWKVLPECISQKLASKRQVSDFNNKIANLDISEMLIVIIELAHKYLHAIVLPKKEPSE